LRDDLATKGSRPPAIAHECCADGLDRADRVTVAIALIVRSRRAIRSGDSEEPGVGSGLLCGRRSDFASGTGTARVPSEGFKAESRFLLRRCLGR
jgi:hypothetical protein